MVNRYLRLGTEDSETLRKNLDNTENSLDNILRLLRNYKLSRKKEIILKNKLKVSISALKAKLNATEICFPEDERKAALDKLYREGERNQKQQSKSKKKYASESYENDWQGYSDKDLENPDEELEDIRSQLSKIGA
jgi:hypothetical protein